MKLVKLMLVIVIAGLVVMGCSTKILSVNDNEMGNVLNEGFEDDKNKSAQVIPVTSKPSGATVLVDGVEQGQTPFNLSLKRGAYEYKVEIVKDGYRKEEMVILGKLYQCKSTFFSSWFYTYKPESVGVSLTKE